MSEKWLLVDDEPVFLRSVGDALHSLARDLAARGGLRKFRLPSEILTAQSARQALELIESSPPDLILTDLRMPEVDGYQLLRLVHRRWPAIRKVVLSGAEVNMTPDLLDQAGIELVFRKPRNADELIKIFEALGRLGLVSTSQPTEPEQNQTRKAARMTGRWTAQSSDPAPTAAQGFRGELPGISLIELLQMLIHSGNSSCLIIEGEGGQGCLWLDHGRVLHATVTAPRGSLQGELAVDWILDQSGGKFSVQPFTQPPARTINEPGDHFLMEAARRLDERSRSSRPAPSITRHLERRITVIEETLEEQTEVPAASITRPSSETQTDSAPRLEVLVYSRDGKLLLQENCSQPEVRKDLLDFYHYQFAQMSRLSPCGTVHSTRAESLTHSLWIRSDARHTTMLLADRPGLSQKKLLQLASSLPCQTQLLPYLQTS